MNPTNSFPVLCQDNFFDNPERVRKFRKTNPEETKNMAALLAGPVIN